MLNPRDSNKEPLLLLRRVCGTVVMNTQICQTWSKSTRFDVFIMKGVSCSRGHRTPCPVLSEAVPSQRPVCPPRASSPTGRRQARRGAGAATRVHTGPPQSPVKTTGRHLPKRQAREKALLLGAISQLLKSVIRRTKGQLFRSYVWMAPTEELAGF